MRHLTRINAALESEAIIPELPAAPTKLESDVQATVAEEIAYIKEEIGDIETSIQKVESSLEQLSFYRDVLESNASGISKESADLIGFGLHTAVRNVGMSLRSKGVDLESFADIVDTIPVVRDLRSEEDKTNDFAEDIANGNVQTVALEDDHSDEDINAGIDDKGEEKSTEGVDEAPADESSEEVPSTDTPAEEVPSTDITDVIDDDTGATEDVPPTSEPHQPIEEPSALQEDNSQSPVINMVMKEGEVQISIESIDNFSKRLQCTMESLIVDIFRGIGEMIHRLKGGYESVGRDAQKLLVEVEAFVEKVNSKEVKVEGTIAHSDRLAYKGKMDIDSVLAGQVALQNTFNVLVNKLPKMIDEVEGKVNKAIDSVLKMDKDSDTKKMEDLKLAQEIYRDYKQSLIDVYPKDLPGGYQVEYSDQTFNWSSVTSYTKSSNEFVDVKDVNKLIDLVSNVIAMSKLFSARQSMLETIEKRQVINKAMAKRSVDSIWSLGLKSQLETIEKEHAKNVALYFEMVYKHCLSTMSYVRSAIDWSE